MADTFGDKIMEVLAHGGDVLNQGIAGINTGINIRIEIAKAQTRAEEMEGRIREQMVRLGTSVYAGWEQDVLDETEIRVCCRSIASLKEEKAALEKKIEDLKEALKTGTPVCTACGAKLHDGAAFCGVCGAKVTGAAPEEPEKKNVCPACGNPTEEGARFCYACGANLEKGNGD